MKDSKKKDTGVRLPLTLSLTKDEQERLFSLARRLAAANGIDVPPATMGRGCLLRGLEEMERGLK